MDTEKIIGMLDQILDEVNQIHQLLRDRLPPKDLVKELTSLKPEKLFEIIKAAHDEIANETRSQIFRPPFKPSDV